MAQNIDKLNDWTIMVYMAGDNNLSESMAKAIYDAKNTIKSNGKVSLLVYFDSKVSAVETKYYDIMDDANSVNVKDSQTFQKFINKKRAPASIKESSSSKDSIVNFVNGVLTKHKTEQQIMPYSCQDTAMLLTM
ncbi:MAG: hypothetical protein HC846_10175 [Blastocatellia bacterium]|nr:hypothetical protein [Blastocatellia bacterium]